MANDYHKHRFVITPRDPGWNSVLWLRQLTEPPPFLHEDDWPLVEHIRRTGQLNSGSMVATDDWFDRPIWDGPVPRDGNAAERVSAETQEQIRKRIKAQADARAASLKEYREAWLIANAQRRRAKAERIKRERDAYETKEARKQYDLEAKLLRAKRDLEQRQRDIEWERATDAERERLALSEAQRQKAAAERAQAAVRRKLEAESAALVQRSEYEKNEYAKQRSEMRQRFAILLRQARSPHERRDRLKSHIMEVLRMAHAFSGQTEMQVGELMDIVGCESEAEMANCCYELGLNYRPD